MQVIKQVSGGRKKKTEDVGLLHSQIFSANMGSGSGFELYSVVSVYYFPFFYLIDTELNILAVMGGVFSGPHLHNVDGRTLTHCAL